MAKESINVDPLDKNTDAKVGQGHRGSTHQEYLGRVAVYGNGDAVRAGEDTTDPGVHNGPNLIGTSEEANYEAHGLEVNDAYKAAVGGGGGAKQRVPAENKARQATEGK